tara:strand:- start:1277 stop:1729 length:453 start_codon:yes stop_codon:yes gene_type:complete
MADLTTTVTESVVLNGALRGNTNSVTTTGINNVFERILTCVNSQETTVAVFGTAPYSAAGAIDVQNARYIRITNLDAAAWIEVAIVTTATTYTVLLTPGNSHILAQGEAVVLAETGTTPSFGTLENLASIIVKPVGVSFDPQVSIFVAAL